MVMSLAALPAAAGTITRTTPGVDNAAPYSMYWVGGDSIADNRTSSGGYTITMADIDGDGDDDMIAGLPNHYNDQAGSTAYGAVRVYKNNAGTFATPYFWSTEQAAVSYSLGQQLSAGDVNGDGNADILAQTSSDGCWLYTTVSSGGISAGPAWKFPAAAGYPGWYASPMYHSLLADLNQDGIKGRFRVLGGNIH